MPRTLREAYLALQERLSGLTGPQVIIDPHHIEVSQPEHRVPRHVAAKAKRARIARKPRD